MLAMIVAFVIGQTDKEIDRYIEIADATKAAAIKGLSDYAKDHKASRQQIGKAIAGIRAGKIEPPIFPLTSGMKKGDIGSIVYCRIVQVISENDVIVETRLPRKGAQPSKVYLADGIPKWSSISIDDERSFLWIDTDTTGLVDNKEEWSIPGAFIFVGTKRYTSVDGGSRTVLHLKVIADDRIKARRNAQPNKAATKDAKHIKPTKPKTVRQVG